MKPDLDSIYAELDLRPSCTLEEFQRAYRRRIAELHPDRSGRDANSPENQAVLQNLIWVYARVNRFHRRYGRMPGGIPPHLHLGNGGLSTLAGRGHYPPPEERQDGSEESRPRATMTLVALFIALLILLASWSWLTGGVSGDARSHLATPDRTPSIAVAPDDANKFGGRAATAQRVSAAGRPVNAHHA